MTLDYESFEFSGSFLQTCLGITRSVNSDVLFGGVLAIELC